MSEFDEGMRLIGLWFDKNNLRKPTIVFGFNAASDLYPMECKLKQEMKLRPNYPVFGEPNNVDGLQFNLSIVRQRHVLE